MSENISYKLKKQGNNQPPIKYSQHCSLVYIINSHVACQLKALAYLKPLHSHAVAVNNNPVNHS